MRAKIAFIGTHGVGKTILTFMLASELRKKNIDADVAYENSRHSPFPINESTTLEGQMWILAAQWKSELEASLRSDIVVCDRSVLDNYAYMVKACGRQEYLHPFLRQWLSTYDILFFVPIIEEQVAADGTRSVSREFQNEIHRIVTELVDEFDIRDRVAFLPTERSRHLGRVFDTICEHYPDLARHLDHAIGHLRRRKLIRRVPVGQLSLF